MLQRKTKVIRILIDEDLADLLDDYASRRFLHCQGYRTKFLKMAIKILICIEHDLELVFAINKVVNERYTHEEYNDRLSAFIIDSIKKNLN